MDTVPANLVHRLDSIFMNAVGVDTVELGALLMEMTSPLIELPLIDGVGEVCGSVLVNPSHVAHAREIATGPGRTPLCRSDKPQYHVKVTMCDGREFTIAGRLAELRERIIGIHQNA